MIGPHLNELEWFFFLFYQSRRLAANFWRLNFRAWNNQLRQPIFVTTTNWVVERAPMEGFLHQTNNLDTLGFDERETKCEM